MNLVGVILREGTSVPCCDCGRMVPEWRKKDFGLTSVGHVYADLDGPSYQAYYCGDCVPTEHAAYVQTGMLGDLVVCTCGYRGPELKAAGAETSLRLHRREHKRGEAAAL